MSKSIISNDKKCLLCGTTVNLARHHVFYGSANRKISERDGCWVWLCTRHHNMSDAGIHFDRKFDLEVKRMCQTEWEKQYGNREDFISTFGKSYL